MNIYYVYAYLRSKDSKTAKAGTPYYIGKGCNGRAYEEHRRRNVGVHTPKNRKYIVFLEQGLTEIGSLALERRMIKWYGRENIKTGILLNQTDGGEGGSGRIDSEDTKRRRKESNTGKKRSINARKNIITGRMHIDYSGDKNPFYNKTHTSATKKHLATIRKNKSYEEIYGDNANYIRQLRSKELKGNNRAAGPQKVVTCPHCNNTGGKGNMKRYHFDKCKLANFTVYEEKIISALI